MHPGLSDGAQQQPTVALLGPPNCGKTTLFNALTGSHSATANYPGATVELSVGTLRPELELKARVVDLPGIASLVPRSPDEQVTVRSLLGDAAHPRPDMAIAVVDCSQLSRHLYLVLQLRATGLPMAVAVTMSDLLLRRGRLLDAAALEQRLGCPVTIVDARVGTGVPNLIARSRTVLADGGPVEVRPVTEAGAEYVQAAYAETERLEAACVRPLQPDCECCRERQGPGLDPQTRRIDGVLLHPVLGLVAFALVMAALFTGVFWVARPAMDVLAGACNWAADAVVALAPESFVARLLGDGVIRGAGAVLAFVPQIVILFLGLGLMEDSGYLARAAVLVDRPLALVGLNGRSFVPLLSGFACAIPGILAARTIPNRRERLLTIFIMPLMSCSARIPVYALLLAFLTPVDKPWVGGVGLTAIYLMSIVSATAVAALVSRFVPARGRSSFMLELPTYRVPQLTVIGRSTYQRTRTYLVKAGIPILIISTMLWLLCNLPSVPTAGLPAAAAQSRQLESSLAGAAGKLLEPLMRPLGLDWRVGVALIASFAAREVFVGSMVVIFHVPGDGADTDQMPLVTTMQQVRLADGSPLFTTASGIGLVVFFIFAMQCMSTAAVARKEAGTWWMPIAQTGAFTGLAYVAAWATVTGLRALGVA